MNILEELRNRYRTASVDDLRMVCASADIPPHVLQNIGEELDSLSYVAPGTDSYVDSLVHVAYVASLPWNKRTQDVRDIGKIETALNQSECCSDYVRERILKYLVKKLLKNRKPKILVVDDEKIALESLELGLETEGYMVVTAGNGAEAIEKLKKEDFDVVLTDLIMGDVDGGSVLKEVKSSRPDTKVIMITGYATVDTAVEAMRMGAFHYIEKPLRLDEVRAVVKEAVRQKAVAEESGVLCFTGNSDNEKVRVGEAIAGALGRKFIKISLDSIRDEGDIMGRGRTAKDAGPGRILEELCRSGVDNPVVMLHSNGAEDNVNGELVPAVMEIVDPRKNYGFVDRYLEVPYNLSDAIFIVTARKADNLQTTLGNKLEVIEL